EDLASALEFRLDSRLNELFVPTGDYGLYRDAVFRWGLNHAHVAQPDQGHVQSARNGSGRHGKYVHLLAHLLQTFFVTYTKTLLLVYYQQAQVGKLHIFRDQAVGADQD